MKTAIITGQSRGLGKALAEKFREGGYEVPRCTRDEVDVGDVESLRIFTDRIGDVDVLVNNAAILGPVGPLEDNRWSDWETTFHVNLFAPALMVRSLLPKMPIGGRIINLAGGGATNPLPRRSAYASSKAALARFTECIAEELRDREITANCVLPGPLPTNMRQEILDAGEEVETPQFDAMDRAVALCLWLASPEAQHVTGRCISARFDKWPFASLGNQQYTLRRSV